MVAGASHKQQKPGPRRRTSSTSLQQKAGLAPGQVRFLFLQYHLDNPNCWNGRSVQTIYNPDNRGRNYKNWVWGNSSKFVFAVNMTSWLRLQFYILSVDLYVISFNMGSSKTIKILMMSYLLQGVLYRLTIYSHSVDNLMH